MRYDEFIGMIRRTQSAFEPTRKRAMQVLGDFWMSEYFDRYIRNNDHYRNAIDYIDNNPVKANLVTEPQQWKWCSAGCDAGGDDRAPRCDAGEDDRAPSKARTSCGHGKLL